MAMCSFADQFSMFDVTPVENLFIDEYMLRAPGEFVKVYIYGLRLCYHPVESATITTIAQALGMEEKTVLDAFAYWERQRVLRRVSDKPPTYCYNNLKQLMVSDSGNEDEIPQANREFNQALQELFGTRILLAQEYDRAWGWIEDLQFKPEVVLMLVRYCIENSGRKTAVTFNSIEKEAMKWKKKGATTLIAAEEHVRTLSASYEGAQRVVRQFGERRAPTMDEESMYIKWTSQWGFGLDAILFACRETTKINRPSFNYLDKVLENMRKKQALTSMDMDKAEKQRKDALDPVRAVLTALGIKGISPTEDMAAQYAGWLGRGFQPEAILRAAQYAADKNKSSLNDLDKILHSFERSSLFTFEQVSGFILKYERMEQQLKRIFDAAGMKRGISSGDYRLLENWQARGYSADLMLYAAECAKDANEPMSYMAQVLENWFARGVTTVENAKAERQRFAETRKTEPAAPRYTATPAQPSSRPSKEVSGHRFDQRTYTDEELDELFATNLDDMEP